MFVRAFPVPNKFTGLTMPKGERQQQSADEDGLLRGSSPEAQQPLISSAEAEQIHSDFSHPANQHVASFKYHITDPASEGTKAAVAAVQRDGFVVLRELLSNEQITEIKAALAPHLSEKGRRGRNHFEGKQTRRVYALLNKSRVFDQLLLH